MAGKGNFCRFFPYYGAKQRHIGKYPHPRYSTIVEPFAGSAAYATRYYWLDVVLADIDEYICAVWDYLIRTPGSEIRSIPYDVRHVDEIPPEFPQEARWLVGYWLQPGGQRPALAMSSRAMLRPDTAWSKRTRDRTAHQTDQIKHWKIYQCSYDQLPNATATWFVDPPYQNPAGRHYRCNNEWLDYQYLGEWCKSRQGHVIACENDGATWLPFEYLAEFHSSLTTFNGKHSGRMSAEAIWEKCDDALCPA